MNPNHPLLKDVDFWFDVVEKSTFERSVFMRDYSGRPRTIYHRSIETCAGKLRISIDVRTTEDKIFGIAVTFRLSRHFKISAKFRKHIYSSFPLYHGQSTEDDRSIMLSLNNDESIQLNAAPLWGAFEMKRYSNKERANDALSLIILQVSK